MILNGILGALASLSFLLTLWQWLAAWRFPLHRRSAEFRIGANQAGSPSNAPNRSSALHPPVTLLKPLHGADEHTESCLRSWFAQDYPGEIQMLFAVSEDADPVCDIVKKLLLEFPTHQARLVVCSSRCGVNAKVSKLAQLEPEAKHEIIVVSDADVFVPPDLLTNLIPPLTQSVGHKHSAESSRGNSASESERRVPALRESEPREAGASRSDRAVAGSDAHPMLKAEAPHNPAFPKTEDHRSPALSALLRREGRENAGAPIGLVNCFYRLTNSTTLASRCDAVAVNADFWSQVLQSRSLSRLEFALGAVMAVRRDALKQIGGFAAFADHLADDYQLGRRIARAGWRIEFCPVVVECRDVAKSWRRIWARQLRWARTIRVCEPWPYFFSLLSNATLWPLLWLALEPAPISLAAGCGFIVVRIAAALDLQRRLNRSSGHFRDFWLVPVKDLLQVAIWALAFTSRSVEWHGERFWLRRDGTMERCPTASRMKGPGA